MDIKGEVAAALTGKFPYYAKGIIPGGSYSGVDRDVQSIGVKAVLVTTEEASDKAVETVVKAVLENFEDFKNLHPAYKAITKESLLEGVAAPLHPAAKKVFDAAGL